MLSVCVVFIVSLQTLVAVSNEPEQIHLSYTTIVNEMAVTWSTQESTTAPYVEFNERNSNLTSKVNAVMSKFVDGGSQHRVLYMYRAVMTNLTLNTSYGRRDEIECRSLIFIVP